MAKLEEKVDAELLASYAPGGSVSVPVNNNEYNERVLRMLKAVYQDDEHGWTVELTSDQKDSQDYLVFR